MELFLCKMTKSLARQYFRSFELDPDLFLDKSQYVPYVYSNDKSDAVVERYEKMGRVYLAVMLDDEPIGEVILKDIDRLRECCSMGISMRSDEYKNQGYGTQAEILALKYAFLEMKLKTVLADALVTNTRSQHVLEKVGFEKMYQDNTFIYYQCEKSRWNIPK